MMFVPGNNPGMMQDAHIYGPDCIMLDLEDSVTMAEKDAARLRELSSSEVMVGLPIYYLPIEMRISPSSGQTFDHTIESIVHENVSFLERMKNTKFNL